MTGFVQQFLSLSRHLLLFASVLAAWPFLRERPDFRGLSDGVVDGHMQRVGQSSPEGWALHGAWEISSRDVRVAGLSALACRDDGRLEIATDLGNLITLDRPDDASETTSLSIRGHHALVEAEALLLRGDQRIMAQENRGELLFLGPDGSAMAHRLPVATLRTNRGIEAMLDLDDAEGALLAFHEHGKVAYRVSAGTVTPIPVVGARMSITEAAWHPDGRAFVLLRSFGPTGFRSAVAQARISDERIELGEPLALPLPINANAEGLCVEPRGAGGSTRLWVVSDDNGLPVMAQRLVAWDVPDDAWPSAPGRADD